jgi:hypothetical protein
VDRGGGEADHALGHFKVATMVDADLGDDQRWVSGTDDTMCDLHKKSPKKF